MFTLDRNVPELYFVKMNEVLVGLYLQLFYTFPSKNNKPLKMGFILHVKLHTSFIKIINYIYCIVYTVV